MGVTDSTQQTPNDENNQSPDQNNSQSQTTPPGDIPILLHVYKPSPESPQSSIPGIYHSGLEIYGSEYYFAGGGGITTGVRVQRPKTQPNGSQWVYDQSVEIAKVGLTRSKVREIASKVRSEFPSNSYHVTGKNCNHFSDAFSKALTGGQGSVFPFFEGSPFFCICGFLGMWASWRLFSLAFSRV